MDLCITTYLPNLSQVIFVWNKEKLLSTFGM